jgi:hypothetical protein
VLEGGTNGLATNGVLDVNSQSTSTVKFTPDFTATGPATFSIQARDSQGAMSSVVTITLEFSECCGLNAISTRPDMAGQRPGPPLRHQRARLTAKPTFSVPSHKSRQALTDHGLLPLHAHP